MSLVNQEYIYMSTIIAALTDVHQTRHLSSIPDGASCQPPRLSSLLQSSASLLSFLFSILLLLNTTLSSLNIALLDPRQYQDTVPWFCPTNNQSF